MKIALLGAWGSSENKEESVYKNNLVNLKQHSNVSRFYCFGQNRKTMENIHMIKRVIINALKNRRYCN